jgi:hypothetical protein
LNPCFHGSGPCYSLVTTSTNCCGIYQNYWDYSPGGCGWAKLKDKKTESDLELLSQTEEILIPSCNGAYVRFETPKREKRKRVVS